MPAKRLSMRKIKEVFRLNAGGVNQRQIPRSCAISRGTVLNIIRRAGQAGVPLAVARVDERGSTRNETVSPVGGLDRSAIQVMGRSL